MKSLQRFIQSLAFLCIFCLAHFTTYWVRASDSSDAVDSDAFTIKIIRDPLDVWTWLGPPRRATTCSPSPMAPTTSL